MLVVTVRTVNYLQPELNLLCHAPAHIGHYLQSDLSLNMLYFRTPSRTKPTFSSTRMDAGFQAKTRASSLANSLPNNAYAIIAFTAAVAMPLPQ